MGISTKKRISINNSPYEFNEWSAGDIVTSAKLNNIEQGIANSSSIFVVNIDDNGYLDKTWQEIYDGNYYFIVNKIFSQASVGLPNNTRKSIYIISDMYISSSTQIINATKIGDNGIEIVSFVANYENPYPQLVTADE